MTKILTPTILNQGFNALTMDDDKCTIIKSIQLGDGGSFLSNGELGGYTPMRSNIDGAPITLRSLKKTVNFFKGDLHTTSIGENCVRIFINLEGDALCENFWITELGIVIVTYEQDKNGNFIVDPNAEEELFAVYSEVDRNLGQSSQGNLLLDIDLSMMDFSNDDIAISDETINLLFQDKNEKLYDLTSLSTYDVLNKPESVAVSEGVAYIANGNAGLEIVDVSDPTYPKFLNNYNTLDFACEVVVLNNVAYIAEKSVLEIVDVSNLANPQRLSSYSRNLQDIPNVDMVSMAVVENLVYITHFFLGLQIIDVSNPRKPNLVGTYQKPIVLGLSVFDGKAYLGVGRFLDIIDVSDPTKPYFLGSYDTSGEPQSVCFSSDIVYIADGDSGLHIVDVNNPSNPELLSIYKTEGAAMDVKVSGKVAYVADQDSGLQIIDVNDPTNPILLGSSDPNLYAQRVVVHDNIIYVTDANSTLKIFDLESNRIYEPMVENSFLPGTSRVTSQTDSFNFF